MKAGIAGAGIMGRLLALHLLQAGWQVSVFDHATGDNCSHAAAGLLAPLAELDKSEIMIYRMGVTALKKEWPKILNDLSADIYFRERGSLLVAHPDDNAEMTRILRNILANPDTRNAVHAVKVSELEPDLLRIRQGVHLAVEGQIDNQQVMTVLQAYLLHREVKWHQHKVQRMTAGLITANDIQHEFDFVFDCRGMGAKDSFTQLRALRGELIWLQARNVTLTRPVRVLHPRYGLYIVPRPDHVYLLGASEIEAEDYSPISVRTTLELLTAAYYLHSGFAEARMIKTVTQCRPVLQHHHPEILVNEGMVAVNGLYRHGFLLAPVLASEVMRYLTHGESALHYPEIWRKKHDECAIQQRVS